MRIFWLIPLFTGLLALASCTATRRADRYYRRGLKTTIETSPVFARSFSGFHLVDLASGRALCAVNAERYFTPASNTKILTLATCLNALGDSLPGLRVMGKLLGGDEIRGGQEWVEAWFVTGAGDPTFLHPKFEAWQPVFRYLKTQPVLWTAPVVPVERFGPGWCWDDYSDDYAAERSSFPIYGNTLRVRWEKYRYVVYPKRYEDSLHISASDDGKPGFRRAEFRNQIDRTGSVPDEQLATFEAEIPVFNAEKERFHLLADTLGWPGDNPEILPLYPGKPLAVIRSAPVDTVYRRMMHQSDNFIAEQLLLACAGEKFDTLSAEKMIAWAKDSLFAGLPDPPRWVDGSGLSRYNLMSPRFLTGVLGQLYRAQPQKRLFDLFPAGGRTGTLKGFYAGPDGKPYVFAKSGSMSGVYCLSGYLVTKRGRVLAFSFMHNNFTGSNKPWKQEIGRVLEAVWRRG